MSLSLRSGQTGLPAARNPGYLNSLSSPFERYFVGSLGLAVGALFLAVGAGTLSPGHDTRQTAAVGKATTLPATRTAPKKPLVRDAAPAKTVAEAPVSPTFVASLPHFNIFGHNRAASSLGLRPKANAGILQVSSAADLKDKFAEAGFSLARIRSSGVVPRLTLASLPRDLSGLRSVKTRKSLFIRGVLPLVLQANEAVLRDRMRLLKLMARGAALGETDNLWLADLGLRYGLEKLTGKALLSELKRRVDIVPPSMALAQGAEESGWGTSRFAVEGNAVFGQWTYRKGEGMVPASRDKGKSHEVKAFAELGNSIEAYLHNLNTHWAYKDFRKSRAEMRERRGHIEGSLLIDTLKRYSERGEAYLRTLRTIIRVNGLKAYDRTRLGSVRGEDT